MGDDNFVARQAGESYSLGCQPGKIPSGHGRGLALASGPQVLPPTGQPVKRPDSSSPWGMDGVPVGRGSDGISTRHSRSVESSWYAE